MLQLYGVGRSDRWDLEEGWDTSSFKPYKPVGIHSKLQIGTLCQVSREIRGRPLVNKLKEYPDYPAFTLLGCFIGKELKPRFLGVLGSTGKFTLYTTSGFFINKNIKEELPEEVFKSTLGGLITRLWRI